MPRSERYVTDGAELFRVLHPLADGVVAVENAGSLELLLMPAEEVGRLSPVRNDPRVAGGAPRARRWRLPPVHLLRSARRALGGRRIRTS